MVGCFVNGFIVVRCKLVGFSYVTIHTDTEMQISEASQFDPGARSSRSTKNEGGTDYGISYSNV